MTLTYLWWTAFRRHRVRALLTMLSVAVAFILFGYLAAIHAAFAMGVDLTGADRLIVRHRVSIVQLLPESYEAEIEAIDGVVDATPATWFGGIYQDPKNFFAQMPVRPEEWLDMYPEYVLTKKEREAWLATRTGAVVGRGLADRFGWKTGDRIPLQATIWRADDGSNLWTFDLVGIYDGAEEGTDVSQMFFRYDYFEENRAFAHGTVGWYVIRIADPERAAEVAAAIDDHFANSSAETKTETEGAFVAAFAEQMGNIGAIVTAILAAVFFTILLVAGNTMAQAVRERTSELGVLKALGYTGTTLLLLVVGESLLMTVIGGGLGLAVASWLIAAGDPTGGALATFYFPRSDLLLGIGLVFAVGVAAGLLPGLQALRLDPVTALRRS